MKKLVIAVGALGPLVSQIGFPRQAIAADEPYGISISQGFERDDNIFRRSDPTLLAGQKTRSDTIASTTLSGFAEAKPSRQTVHAALQAIRKSYAQNDFMDHTTMSGDLTWKWQLGNYWSGVLGIDQRQQMRPYSELMSAEKDINTTRNAILRMRYWLHPDWAFGVSHRLVSSRYSNTLSDANEYNERWYEAGVTFHRENGNEIEGVLQHIDGSYPNQTSAQKEYDQDAVVLRGNWAIAAHSDFDGYVSVSKRTYSGSASNDFNGVLWRTSYRWRPTAKLEFAATVRRELGDQQDIVSNRIVTEGTGLAGSWSPTTKTKATYGIEWLRRDSSGLAAARDEVIRGQRIEVSYMPRDFIDLAFVVRREGRRAATDQRNYDVDTASILVRFKK